MTDRRPMTAEEEARIRAYFAEEVATEKRMLDTPRGFRLPHDPEVIYAKDQGYDG